MEEEKVFISKICTNSGQTIKLNHDDIVVFVGPNNVGKSQCLKDIYTLTKQSPDTESIVIKSIEKEIDQIDASNYLKRYGVQREGGSFNKDFYNVLGINIYDGKNFKQKSNYGSYRDLFIANLNTENRLEIAKPAQNINGEYVFNHPILYAGYKNEYRKWLSDNYKKAFSEDLIPNINAGNIVPLCIGKTPDFSGEHFENEIERHEKLVETLRPYKKVHLQGDGIRSFTGVLLYLMLPFFKTYLIDEPESFLHQPQATMMGRIIGESTIDRQCFISTHSEYLLNGLLDSAPNRVKVIRITREGDINRMSCLDNQKLQDIWKNPILKHSNILSGIFYSNVAICESDSDCKMYSIINDYLKIKEGKYSNTLFVHCGGKHRIADVASALKALNVDLRIITDIDALNDKSVIKNIISSVGGDFASIEKKYDILVKSLNSKGNPKTKQEIVDSIKAISEMSHEKYLTSLELEKIKALLKPNSSWNALKESGLSSIPSGEASSSAKVIFDYLKSISVFILPVGELESFIKTVGGHGPQWVNEVLKQYPDFNHEIYDSLKSFVLSLNI